MNEKEIVLEQYKLYVEMADRVSTRRAQTNKFYISLLSGLLVLLSIIIEKNMFSNNINILFLIISFIGIILNILWFINIRSYRQLNSGKFKVIHELESLLPYPCYKREWEILKEGKDRKIYLQLTRVEKYVPFILIIPYLILFLYSFTIIIKVLF